MCKTHTHTCTHTHTNTHTHTLTQGGSSSQASRGGRESTKSILEDVPVLWDEELYKSEYDLSNFMQSQTISNHWTVTVIHTICMFDQCIQGLTTIIIIIIFCCYGNNCNYALKSFFYAFLVQKLTRLDMHHLLCVTHQWHHTDLTSLSTSLATDSRELPTLRLCSS